MVISIFLFAAFISFLIVGNADESEVGQSAVQNLDGIKNKGGRFGASVASLFIRSWFGVSAFLIPFVTFLLGFRIAFRFSLLPIAKSLRHVLFMFYWLPLSMAYLFDNSTFLAGQLGVFLHQKSDAQIGDVGTPLLIIF